MSDAATVRRPARWREEVVDFLAFVRHPRLGPRLPRTGSRGRYPSQEWLGGVSWSRLLAWALLLWGVNLLLLGPLAAGLAGSSGVESRVTPRALSWFQVVLWAPVMEELMFRFPLRRPAPGLWLAPFAFLGVLLGPRWLPAVCLAVACLAVWRAAARGHGWPRRWLRGYHRAFPWVFHAVTLLFAMLHLLNFRLGAAGPWLLPALVLPQWMAGLVLGWMRVRFGIGASMALHGLFNAGPMVLIWFAQRYVPGALA